MWFLACAAPEGPSSPILYVTQVPVVRNGDTTRGGGPGGVAGWLGFATRVPASATALSLLLVGILVAADRRAPSATPIALAAGVGSLHGALNGAALAGAGGEALLALAGTAGAVLVVSLLVSRGVSSVNRPWQRVAVRAAGSWIAAIGLLYLGWALKGS